MKKVIIIISCFLFISCFTEPKKANEKKEEIVEKKVDNTKKKSSILDTIRNDNIVQKLDTILDEKVIKNNLCIEKLVSLLNKSADEFENFAFENDYYFDEIKTYEYFKVLYYKKSNGFISFAVDKTDNTTMEMIQLETNSKNLYLSLKEEASKLGYKFADTKTFDKRIADKERIYSQYTNGKYELNFIITNEPNKLGYSVGINKSRNNK